MAAGVRIVYVRTPAVCFRMHIVLLSIRFYAKVLNSINFSQIVMGYLEKYRIFVPELRRSLHIAKYRNEQKSARFHIVTYIIQANAQLLDFQSKSNFERVTGNNRPTWGESFSFRVGRSVFYLLLLNRKKLPPALRETNHLYTADWQFLCFLLFLQQLL